MRPRSLRAETSSLYDTGRLGSVAPRKQEHGENLTNFKIINFPDSRQLSAMESKNCGTRSARGRAQPFKVKLEGPSWPANLLQPPNPSSKNHTIG